MTNPVWSSPNGTLVGSGHLERIDPGTGPHRYSRAARMLSVSGRTIGLASFTFDPERPGSLILAPEAVEQEWSPSHGDMPTGAITDDGRQAWEEGFDTAMSAVRRGQVEKVVLARRMTVDMGEAVPVDHLLARLGALNPASHVFSIEGLVGASPELLIRVSGGRAESLVLAGSAGHPSALRGEKLRIEHELAARAVESALLPLTESLRSEHSPIVFGDISHLATRFEGAPLPGVGVLDFVAAMHPTPAVCGTPTTDALHLIRRMEPASRGRYAGPVGWFDLIGDGEFALALRCGQVSGTRITLHAGGGLVAGSTMEAEYDETDLKFGPMLRALGIGPAQH